MLLRNLQSIILEQTRAGEVEGLASLQRRLAEQTRALIEQTGPGRPSPGGDAGGPQDGGGR